MAFHRQNSDRVKMLKSNLESKSLVKNLSSESPPEPRGTRLGWPLGLGSRRIMAKYEIQSTRGAPPRGAYSQGWRAGDFIFVTGTGPNDPVSGELAGDTIERQTEQTIDNMLAILEADGASLSDVVKVTVHLSDTALFARYNAVYARRFSKPYPVRTTVGSDLGHSAGMLIEMDCVAYSAGKTRTKKTSKKKRS
jgi:2-iminobutanoate/2-iminopropanoate deaminase